MFFEAVRWVDVSVPRPNELPCLPLSRHCCFTNNTATIINIEIEQIKNYLGWPVSISLIIKISLTSFTCMIHTCILNKFVYWASSTFAVHTTASLTNYHIKNGTSSHLKGFTVSWAWNHSFHLKIDMQDRCVITRLLMCTWEIYERCIIMNRRCWVCLGSNYCNIHSPQVPVVKVKSIRTVSGWQLCHLTTVGDCAMSKCPCTHRQ